MRRAANNLIYQTSISKQVHEVQAQLPPGSFHQQFGLHLIRGISSHQRFVDLGEKLVGLAEQAYAFRRFDRLGELSQALLSLPLPREYRAAAGYFRGLELIRRGDVDGAKSVLEAVAAEPSHKFTARAIQSLGVTFHARGDSESALKLYIEAGCRAVETKRVDPVAAFASRKNIAVLRSEQGDHQGALADLRGMSQLAKVVGSIHAQAYYDYLNSLAVEFGELGHLEEAVRASRLSLSSPFAIAYPEWGQTFEEIASKRQRSSQSSGAVRGAIIKEPGNQESVPKTHTLVHLPVAEGPNPAAPAHRPQPGTRARVLSFQRWKTTIKASGRATPVGVAAGLRSRMTTGEKLIRLMDLISQDETDDETIDRILETVEQIVIKRRSQNLD